MDFEDLSKSTEIRLKNNGINNEEDLINVLLNRIEELEEICNKDDQTSFWRNSKKAHQRVGAD